MIQEGHSKASHRESLQFWGEINVISIDDKINGGVCLAMDKPFIMFIYYKAGVFRNMTPL